MNPLHATDYSVPCLLHRAIAAQLLWQERNAVDSLTTSQRNAVIAKARTGASTHDLMVFIQKNYGVPLTMHQVRALRGSVRNRSRAWLTPEVELEIVGMFLEDLPITRIEEVVSSKYTVRCGRKTIYRVLQNHRPNGWDQILTRESRRRRHLRRRDPTPREF